MAKSAVAGRVKTRLARQIGVVAATRFYRWSSSSVVERLSSDPRWRTELAVASTSAGSACRWPATVEVSSQGRGDLGRRMAGIFHDARPGMIAIVGTDIPAIAPRHIARAFHLLRSNDVVFGPASDGGFWLMALKRTPRIVVNFDTVRWSTPFALGDCVSACDSRRVAFADRLTDIDDASDLTRIGDWAGRRILPALLGTPIK